MADSRVFGVFISKLGHWKKPGPIILLEVHKGLEVHFYCTILSLSLAINLMVKSGRKLLFNAEEVAE